MDFGLENRIPNGSKILVAMSGGVDSSIAAHRLNRAGYDVIGITMHLVHQEYKPVSGAQVDSDRACCSLSMAEDARRVSSVLDFPYYVLNMADEFRQNVVEPSRFEYARGRTPNPCILCNRRMKFDVLFRRADALGCEFIATGHYSKIGVDDAGHHLYRAKDASKDQSYFLSYLTENELARVIFPLGDERKEDVRAEAKEIGLKVADRPDSQDLCFFASGEPPDEWIRRNGSGSGEIVTTGGEVIGEHDGIRNFTVGQRKGLPGGMPEKLYVVNIEPATNRVIVGTEDKCFSSGFQIEDISLVSSGRKESSKGKEFEIQIRYRSKPVKGRVYLNCDDLGHIELDEPARSITPGQAAVWYEGEEVIGAGTISKVEI